MREKWRSVIGYEGRYEISDCGNVRSFQIGDRRLKIPRLRKLYLGKRGRLVVSLKKHSMVDTRYVHRLILEAFVGLCPSGQECRHLDGNPFNNHLNNLTWGTPTENQADRTRHGTDNRGERCGAAKLIWSEVREIRLLASRCYSVSQACLAKLFGVSQPTISGILRGVTWQELV